MKAVLTLTDLTRMHGDWICVAGYTDEGECVRPILRYGHLTESWLFAGKTQIIRPFACVELDLLRNVPDPPHTEDWEISASAPDYRGELSPAKRRVFLSGIADANVEESFGAPVHHDLGHWVEAGQGHRSLGTVRVHVRQVNYALTDDGKWDYRVTFADSTRVYRLKVTDLAFRSFLDFQRICRGLDAERVSTDLLRTLSSREVYLRIGLSRHWAKFPDRRYLQINGVYSFPDYLEGRGFADYAVRPEAKRVANPVRLPQWDADLADLPF